MRRLKVVLREEAVADLADIYNHIARVGGSHVTAIGFVRRIKARCQRIGNVPMGGIARDDLQPGLRTVPFEHSAVIAYVVENDQVSVTNVFYGGRDYDALYRGTERSKADQDE
jgi:toxin ParE1/3/4